MRCSYWSSYVCASDLDGVVAGTVLACGVAVDRGDEVAGEGVAILAGRQGVAGDLRQVVATCAFARVTDPDLVVAGRGACASRGVLGIRRAVVAQGHGVAADPVVAVQRGDGVVAGRGAAAQVVDDRSEEHTSELQSLMRTSYAVF